MTGDDTGMAVRAATHSRNAMCSCGSGKRYKHCCGASTGSAIESASAGASPSPAIPTIPTMNLALEAQQRGDLTRAANLYRQVLLAEPENINALHMLGVIHFAENDLDEAERLIRYAESLCPAPVQIIQHNLMMLREKIAVSNRPTEPLAAVRIESPDSPATHVEEVRAAQEITLPALSSEGATDTAGLAGTPEQQALFPSIKTFVLENAVIDAESAVPATATMLVVDSHVDLDRHQPPEWRYGLYRRGAQENEMARTLGVSDFKHSRLPAAIVLTSTYWANWAHFLTEVLPKALIADRRADWRDWPMLISSAGLANAQELLRLLVAADRRIIKACGRIVVDRAGYVSSVGFCPLEYAYDWKTDFPRIRPTDCVFSPDALGLVRNAARRLVSAAASATPAFLYLRRTGSNRRFLNQDEVEEVFRARGFEIIVPEKLSVREQIALFSRARVIAGPTGAAIANLVFAAPGCRLLVLAAINRHWPFHYWLNMAHAAGHHLQYLFGHAAGASPHPAHPDLYFDNLSRLGSSIDVAIREAGSS